MLVIFCFQIFRLGIRNLINSLIVIGSSGMEISCVFVPVSNEKRAETNDVFYFYKDTPITIHLSYSTFWLERWEFTYVYAMNYLFIVNLYAFNIILQIFWKYDQKFKIFRATRYSNVNQLFNIFVWKHFTRISAKYRFLQYQDFGKRIIVRNDAWCLITYVYFHCSWSALVWPCIYDHTPLKGSRIDW